MVPNASIQASTPKKIPEAKMAHHLSSDVGLPSPAPLIVEPEPPRTPQSKHANDHPPKLRPGSGSPLKLFGHYDRFTNQKLLRRLSQFENSLHEESPEAS